MTRIIDPNNPTVGNRIEEANARSVSNELAIQKLLAGQVNMRMTLNLQAEIIKKLLTKVGLELQAVVDEIYAEKEKEANEQAKEPPK